MTATQSRIPEFRTLAEEAAWWESHDPADHQDELKTVRVHFAKNLSAGLHIRLDQESLAQLRVVAQRKGLGPTTLARMWIKEHLTAVH